MRTPGCASLIGPAPLASGVFRTKVGTAVSPGTGLAAVEAAFRALDAAGPQ